MISSLQKLGSSCQFCGEFGNHLFFGRKKRCTYKYQYESKKYSNSSTRSTFLVRGVLWCTFKSSATVCSAKMKKVVHEPPLQLEYQLVVALLSVLEKYQSGCNSNNNIIQHGPYQPPIIRSLYKSFQLELKEEVDQAFVNSLYRCINFWFSWTYRRICPCSFLGCWVAGW